MRSSSVPRRFLRALFAFAAVATVVVADAVTGPLYHYKILDNLENEQVDEATYLIMFGHGAATHTNDETFLDLYHPFRDENRAPENLIQRLQWNDPELTEDGEETAQHLRNEFLRLIWPHVKRSQRNVVFMASSMAHALETALITVSTPMLGEINAKWTVSDDLRDRNSGFGTAWRRSLTEQSYYCPTEFVALALEAGRQTVHKTNWEITNSMTSAYMHEAVDFSGLPERDPLRIEPLFDPYDWFFEPGTLDYVDDFQLNFETEEDAMGRVASVLIPALQERPAFAVVAAHPDTIEYALHLGKNVGRPLTPENIDTAKLLILKITGVSDAYRQRNHYY